MRRRGNNAVGDLMKEIQEQDLMAPVGGNKEGAEPNLLVTVITMITALTAWSQDKLTKKYNCGGVISISAECNGGKGC